MCCCIAVCDSTLYGGPEQTGKSGGKANGTLIQGKYQKKIQDTYIFSSCKAHKQGLDRKSI
jgi:hypothetical protein